MSRDMAKDATPIQSVINTFEKRARWRQCEAYGFLLLMLAGIVAAGLVFYFAKAITDTETTTDIASNIDHLKQITAENARRINEKGRALGNAYASLLNELPAVSNESCNKISSQPPDLKRIFLSDDGKLRSKNEVAKEFRSWALTPDTDCISVQLPFSQPVQRLIFNIKQLEQVEEMKEQNWNSTNPSDLENYLDKLLHEANINKLAIDRLRFLLSQQEMAPLTGEQPASDQPTKISWQYLVQLNITKYGTIALVVIALGRLIPLSQVDQYLGLAGQIRNGAGFDFFGRS
jgi:hypothetical protein